MRINKDRERIDYNETKNFFSQRAKKYNKDNPYMTTMYQDKHPELVMQRNEYEMKKLIPNIVGDGTLDILDMGCGIGRYADAIGDRTDHYLGVDFSEDLISIAQNRYADSKRHEFRTCLIYDVYEDIKKGLLERFDRLLIMGVLVYINDEDIVSILSTAEKCMKDNARIIIREPIGIKERLTLKEEFSEELEAEYNAIYRTDTELKSIFEQAFLKKGFMIEEEGFLFEDKKVNNRKETAQYYYIMNRKDKNM